MVITFALENAPSHFVILFKLEESNEDGPG